MLFSVWPNLDVCKAVYLKCPPVNKVMNGVELPANIFLGAEAWEALVNGLHICTIPEDRHETWLRRGTQYTAKTRLFLASHFFSWERVNALTDALLSLQPYPSTMPVSREEITTVLTEVGGVLPCAQEAKRGTSAAASSPISTTGMM
jgi:hypothetical protein